MGEVGRSEPIYAPKERAPGERYMEVLSWEHRVFVIHNLLTPGVRAFDW
jgi:hypothetical protein